ncbi:response regulator transcription factor [Chelativorans alearense]|uniref:response regulator transcription factor n=1 Tax=Chelativorans alearense TaxID=2681495 RepID=UPI0013D68D8C|nr:response regulator [Chelativorans alearense]
MKPTILIVEDDRATRHSLRMVLEVYGYTVKDFASAEDMAEELPDPRSCLILDVNLPGASGLETLGRLRASGSSIPAVLVTGRPSDKLRDEAAHLDALAFFEKPINIDALLEAIESIRP